MDFTTKKLAPHRSIRCLKLFATIKAILKLGTSSRFTGLFEMGALAIFMDKTLRMLRNIFPIY
jgi:hypothetical protein